MKFITDNYGSLRISADSETHNNLGLVFARQKKFKEAPHYFSEALKINPHDQKARRIVDMVLQKMGRIEG